MKAIMIGAIIVLALVFAGIVFAGAITSNQATTEQPKSASSCTSCDGKCTQGSNCGLATCGAVNGGKCGCEK